jgi:hypothetical protein
VLGQDHPFGANALWPGSQRGEGDGGGVTG